MTLGDGRAPAKNGLVPPRFRDNVDKKVYPPIRWRPLRVTNPWHKLAFVIGQWLALRGIAAVVGLVLPPYVAGPLVLALLTVVTVALARSFRGPTVQL